MENRYMKFKISIALAMAVFAASFTINSARAEDDPEVQCILRCHQQYQLCMQYTPEKAQLCYFARLECLGNCGIYN
jgi:plasmid maintenance system killer protein